MAFNDLLTSAKGPGVIGLIMALIVLLGFGVLFMFALDEGLQGGGRSLASVIRDADNQIGAAKHRIEMGQKTLDSVPRLRETSAELTSSSGKNKFLATEIAAKKKTITELGETMGQLDDEWEDYKNQYRAYVRTNAAGTSLPELKTTDGTVFTDVEIRKVTAIGIDIRHKNGFKRIDFEELPGEMQDHYQFDKEQMVAEAQREAKVRGKHDKAVAAANDAADAVAAGQRVKDQELQRQKMIGEIAAREAQVISIQGQIRQLEADITNAEAVAAAARAAGRRHLGRSGPLQGALGTKRAELVRIQSEIARMRASL
jgi:chromosome segregation ATPase